MSEIDVRIIDTNDIDPFTLDARADILSADEQARLANFSHAPAALTYRNARILTRTLLAQTLNTTPEGLDFIRSDLGRPSLKDRPNIDFNISHCGSHYMLAIGSGVRVGVDVEYVRPRKQQAAIVAKHFSMREQERYNALRSEVRRAQYFFQIWTLKEAHSKALGVGFSEGFARYDFDITDPENITMQDSFSKEKNTGCLYKNFGISKDAHASLAVLKKCDAALPQINLLKHCNLTPYPLNNQANQGIP